MARKRPADRQGPPYGANRLPGEPTPAEFGARLRAARVAAGLSAADAAKVLGLPPSRLFEWESGRKTPRVTAAVAAVAALGLDPATVFPELFPEKGGGR